MKKLLAFLLALSLVLALSGCTVSQQMNDDPEEDPAPAEETPAEEETPNTGEFLPAEGLEGEVGEAQPGDEMEEEPSETEEELGGVVGTADSYWYESDSGSGQYTDEVGNEMTYSYAVPAFNLDSPDASDMNEEIEEVCSPVIAEMKDAEENGYSLSYGSIAYEAYKNGDIVSILITMNTYFEMVEYHAFNLNVVTGERASGAEMVNAAGMTEDAFLEAAQTATEAKFMELYDGLQDDVDYFEEQLAKTMSADVFSLSAPMYLNGEGKVCIIARIYALAGASYYDHILELG